MPDAHASLARLSEGLTGASASYVKALFDEYAQSFDASLSKLGYRGPSLVGQALRDALNARGVAVPIGRLLDAGCGACAL